MLRAAHHLKRRSGFNFRPQNLRAIGAPNQYLARTGRGRFRVTALMA
jgi:hypothetical protein